MLDSLVRNYSLESKIGEGSFSEVLKVMEKSTGRFFAAKRLTQTFVDLEDVNKYPELKVMLQLQQHPNILNLFEWVYESDCRILTLIFNLMDMSLYEYIRDRKRKLSEQRCKNFLFQLANALAFLHRHGVFHRDVKPEK
jgi:renal tumor antigen